MNDNASGERDTMEKLADSFVTRFRRGERPSIAEYTERYPEFAEQLQQLLPALVLLEQNASLDATESLGCQSLSKPPPREIGDFLILREIGRGGMGVVYEAVQQSLGRHVALKILSSPTLLNPTHLERFQLEARAAARLHHTHIVPVFGVGEHDGLHFYSMQFIHGQSLDLVIDEVRRLRRAPDGVNMTTRGVSEVTQAVADGLLTGHFHAAADGNIEVVSAAPGKTPPEIGPAPSPGGGLAPDSSAKALEQSEFSAGQSRSAFYHGVARVGLQVAEALSYAHSEGVLHRDVKPSNLLLDARGNVWVTDFGLARDESSDGLTRTGDFVGTLRYMAPERLEGWSDRRSDVYSLGATLYELLSLQPFLDTPSRAQLIDQILHQKPKPLRNIDHGIPRDLETIVMKAIAKESACRYESADAMAEDLRRVMADRPILARRSTPTERFVRWCRRSPGVASLTGAVVALLILSIVILAVSNARIRRESAAKDLALQRVRIAAGDPFSRAQYLLDAGDWKQAIEVGEKVASIVDELHLSGSFNSGVQKIATAYKVAAWRLLTAQSMTRLDTDQSVGLAAISVKLAPENGEDWNVLGLAEYRAGDMTNAIKAVHRAMELPNSGDGWGWFVDAMAEWQNGDRRAARDAYQKAIAWTQVNPVSESAVRFRAEATQLLHITELERAALLPATKRLFNPKTGHDYQRINVTMGWHDAQQYCRSLGGHLATVTSNEENQFIYDQFGRDHVCWLGATDEEQVGVWKWVTGEPWKYENWFEGQPDNVNGLEHYLTLGNATTVMVEGRSYVYRFGAKWNDIIASGEYHGVPIAHPVCEWDAHDPVKAVEATKVIEQ